MASRPIFIVGSERSGTTLMRSLINAHPNISCGEETHFLAGLEGIVGSKWRLMKDYPFEKEYWYEKIRELFDSFKTEAAHKQGKLRWGDKTPIYVLKLDFIDALFPDCQVIHMIRDGRDVVASSMDRWGYKRGLSATKRWGKSVRAGQSFGRSVSLERYIEVKYEELVLDPESTMQSVCEFLQEPWEPSLLEEGTYKSALTEKRRQAAGNSEVSFYASRIGVGKKKLDPLVKSLFRYYSGSLLKELGYS
ncbi:sulfotransferase [cf. Phormidesmis sp. LEGE 11477]|uniref:sulfotransferase family protein n=1 Tax=cf. Phormidesmis sp. LEGE 11477 TaxID=1828680 RepID=UPI00188307ED|nr:sulfotransferase [cf. Phormidesmis sp. LEGE 11477]